MFFDENLGGLVSSDGLRDSGADFGNGRYNDHHFHYGYLLYSCAILGNIDRGFVNRYGDAVDAIYRDIAHDKNFKSEKSDQVFFPGARHKIWFDGHSFASGMFPFGNGKSQESSSEAVNAYFGAYLWSLVKHRSIHAPNVDVSSQTDFARLLLATEIRGAQTYWHMLPPDDNSKNVTSAKFATIYSPEFARNYMVGNLGMLDAVSSTWFGTSSLYVHMINEMPVTAITSTLFNTKFVDQEYANSIRPLGEVEMAWRGYVICNHALVDPINAWKDAQGLESG
jgi:endo-1,3(4)-beta-glucanase